MTGRFGWVTVSAALLLVTGAICSYAQERTELPEGVGELIIAGDLDALRENVDFSDKFFSDADLGDPGVGFIIATLPLFGLTAEASNEFLYRDDPDELLRIVERNDLVSRFLFDNGASATGEIDVGFGPIGYIGYLFVAIAEHFNSEQEVIERLAAVVAPQIELFLEYGAEFETPQTSVMALIVSAMLEHRGLFELALMSGADPRAQIDGIGVLGAYLATAYQEQTYDVWFMDRLTDIEGVVDSLVNRESPLGTGYFGLAIEMELVKLVRSMLTAGQDPNAIQVAGEEWTPLHLAAWAGNIETVELLLRSGGDPTARDTAGATPLHVVGGLDGAEIVRILADSGADIEARDSDGATPLLLMEASTSQTR